MWCREPTRAWRAAGHRRALRRLDTLDVGALHWLTMNLPKSELGGQYNGAALNSFLLGLAQSQSLVQKILRDFGVESIDPNRWYDAVWAIPIYYAINEQIGRGAVIAVGKRMIETAPFPPGIDDVRSVLQSLDAAYKLNARGPDTGDITCEFEDECSAVLEWSTWGPCALNIGIMQGCCSRFGAHALVEHAPGGCMDDGAASCVYRVSW